MSYLKLKASNPLKLLATKATFDDGIAFEKKKWSLFP